MFLDKLDGVARTLSTGSEFLSQFETQARSGVLRLAFADGGIDQGDTVLANRSLISHASGETAVVASIDVLLAAKLPHDLLAGLVEEVLISKAGTGGSIRPYRNRRSKPSQTRR